MNPSRLRPYSSAWYQSYRQTLGEATCQQLGLYAFPDGFLLSVVVAVYNEQQTLQDMIRQVSAVPVRKELVLVDDHSTDRSPEILRQMQALLADDPDNRVLLEFHPTNRGKGAALRTGFAKVTGDVVIIQDADLEYDPGDYLRLLQPIITGQADVVYGSRFLGNRPHRVLYFRHYLRNKFLTMVSNCFTNLNLTDMETCYKVFTRRVVADVGPTLRQDRFGFEPEFTAKVARRGYRIYELSVSYFGRTYEEGKKIGWMDGVKALWCIMRYALAD